MRKSQELRKAAADQASAAAEYGQKALKESMIKAQVLLDEGLVRAQDALAKAQAQAAPAIHDARVRSADYAARKLDEIEPQLRGALDRVQPAVETARYKVADDYLPRLSRALHAAAEHPERLAEAIKPVKKTNPFKTFVKVIALGAIVAGAVAAVRHFLAPKDDGWTAHEPSRAYVNNNDTFATAAKVAADSDAMSEAAENEAVAREATEEVAESMPEQDRIQEQTEEAVAAEPAAESASESATGTEARYGEGSYVGETPPEGFTIKGNERSMKYHVPGSGGYERTIAEVWFESEEAAERAGFTRAQR
ncbi:hypothetical protein SAMN04488242_1913 [Tessaracoccus oleiagri]|uniref:Uncharacterized protein n=1 Tax=Tessaracoccus oleiagri TaxID=686624 RepID=A0A1G9L053_9ACTN|nr:hypothetical protein [Tessaracoccus oleiagri]SDL55184.1 hypothetical protein SAMN04488242_1913 [Tessaracoccus oleiagri]